MDHKSSHVIRLLAKGSGLKGADSVTDLKNPDIVSCWNRRPGFHLHTCSATLRVVVKPTSLLARNMELLLLRECLIKLNRLFFK